MTLNLNFLGEKHGPWDVRRQRIVEKINTLGPDIVALQAVRRSGGDRDQARELASCLREPHLSAFVPAVEREDGTADGSAFLARVAPEKLESFQLTAHHPEDRTPRVVVVGRFQLPEGRLTVVNCHFSWIDEQASRNVEETLSRLGSISTPAVLAGDMNSTPDKPAMRRLEKAGWRDTWGELRGDEPGWTFEADRPSIRIDYVWTNPSLGATASRIQVVGDPESRFSDHLALCADVGL